MRITLMPGELLDITFAGDDAQDIDGHITVHHEADPRRPGWSAIVIYSELPDDAGRAGVIYSENRTVDLTLLALAKGEPR